MRLQESFVEFGGHMQARRLLLAARNCDGLAKVGGNLVACFLGHLSLGLDSAADLRTPEVSHLRHSLAARLSGMGSCCHQQRDGDSQREGCGYRYPTEEQAADVAPRHGSG